MTRRGLALSTALSAALLTESAAQAVIPSALLTDTAHAALLVAAGKGGAGVVSPQVAQLIDRGLRTALVFRAKTLSALVLAIGLLATGAGVLCHRALAGKPRADTSEPLVVRASARAGALWAQARTTNDAARQPHAAAASRPAATDKESLVLAGQVLDPDGKPVAKADVAAVGWLNYDSITPRQDVTFYPYSATDEFEVLGQTQTDAAGRFQLRVPKDLRQRFHCIKALAVAPGWALSWQSVDAEANSPDAVIRLRPEHVVRARLIDLQGQPVPQARVDVVRLGDVPIPKHRQYTISAQHMDTGIIFSGDFGERMKIAKKQCSRLEPAGLDFLEAPAGLALWPHAVVTNADGRFTLSGMSRNQEIGLQVAGERYANQALTIPAQDNDGPEEVAVALSPARLLEGTVTDAASGKPVAGAHLTVNTFKDYFGGFGSSGQPDERGRRVEFNHYVSMGSPIHRVKGQTDHNGRFRLNPFVGNTFVITVTGPDGTASLKVQKIVSWIKGAVKLEVNVALPPGVRVRGKVTEQETGTPVNRATVDFWSRTEPPYMHFQPPEVALYPRQVRTDKQGVFENILPAGTWHLLVNGDYGSTYLGRKIEVDKLSPPAAPDKKPAPGTAPPAAGPKPEPRQFFRPDAWVVAELKSGSTAPEMAVTLRRLTLHGKIVGPDGKPVAKALMLRHQRENEWLAQGVEVRDGRFELPITDREASYPLLFLAAEQGLGIAVELAGKQAGGEPITVRLQRCGTARARFVDAQGKPLVHYRPSLWALLPPTEPFGTILELHNAFNNNQDAAGAVWRGHARLKHYAEGPSTDADGVVHFSGLIPGAMHRLVLADQIANQAGSGPGSPKPSPLDLDKLQKEAVKDFKVEPGKPLDLGDITVKQREKPITQAQKTAR